MTCYLIAWLQTFAHPSFHILFPLVKHLFLSCIVWRCVKYCCNGISLFNYCLSNKIHNTIVENKRPTWCHLQFLFHFVCSQHVSDINISIIRILRLFCLITTLVVCSWFDVCWCFRCGWVSVDTTPTQLHRKHQHTSNQEHTTNLVIQQNSRKLLMMDILMPETCWEWEVK
jgi:hypothetical protein